MTILCHHIIPVAKSLVASCFFALLLLLTYHLYYLNFNVDKNGVVSGSFAVKIGLFKNVQTRKLKWSPLWMSILWGVSFFLELLELKQLKSYVRIGRNFQANMALKNKKWHVKTYIHKSPMKISIIHSQHSLPFSNIKKLCTKN